MDVNVNEAGCDEQPARIKMLLALAPQLAGRGYLGHPPVLEQKIVFAFELLCGIDYVAIANCQRS
jgi:hypothetical protein